VGSIGRQLIIIGLLVAVIGIIMVAVERFPGLKIGRLPGDFYFERGSWRFYFPLATSIILSLILTLVFWFFRRR
jgi:hypothetical protein